MTNQTITTLTFRLGEIWKKFPELTLPQVLRALARIDMEVEIMSKSRMGVACGAEVGMRPVNLELATNEEWIEYVDSAFDELYGAA
jgi:hypothetical protein